MIQATFLMTFLLLVLASDEHWATITCTSQAEAANVRRYRVTNHFKIESCTWPFLLEVEALVTGKFKINRLEKHVSALGTVQRDWLRGSLADWVMVILSLVNRNRTPPQERKKDHQCEFASHAKPWILLKVEFHLEFFIHNTRLRCPGNEMAPQEQNIYQDSCMCKICSWVEVQRNPRWDWVFLQVRPELFHRNKQQLCFTCFEW